MNRSTGYLYLGLILAALLSLALVAGCATTQAAAVPVAQPTEQPEELLIVFLFTECGKPIVIESINSQSWHVRTPNHEGFPTLLAKFNESHKADPQRFVLLEIGSKGCQSI